MHSIQQALRQLLRHRSASLLSVGLLALGVGLAASFYSVLDSALLSGLPFPEGDRLVAFSTREAAGWPMPLDDYRAIEATQRTFEWTAPLRTFNTMVTRGDTTSGMIGSYVTADLFGRLGVTPALGRGFEPDDEDPANPPVALISHRLWHSGYGADPEVIGEEIVINREATIVVGVMPPRFHFPLRHDVWGIFRTQGRDWSSSFVFGFAKLADGVGAPKAVEELERITTALDEESPEVQPRNAALESFVRANIGDRARGALRAMVLAALGLMLLTCANLANLRLGETLRRQNEIDTRLALGSGPAGLAKMLLVENLLVGLAGTALALGVAWLLTATLGKALLTGGYLSRIYWIDARLDLSVARFAAALALVATLLGALAPIVSTLLGSRRRPLARGASPARTSMWARSLVGIQVGLCFTLLVTAGVFSMRARDLLDAELGFRPDHLSSIHLSTYQAELEAEQIRPFFERFEDELQLDREIAAVTLSSSPPWGYVPSHPVAPGGEPDPELAPRARVMRIAPDFFEALELPLLAGRELNDGDLADGPGAALVSSSLATRIYDGDALGSTLVVAGTRKGEALQHFRVVGVVADLGVDRADSASKDLNVYVPDTLTETGSFVLVRTRPGVGSAGPAVERTLSRIAPRVGTLDELGVEQALASSIWVERRLGQIFSVFGIAALLLTATGMYAVIAVMVRNRERELGIRAAVGARPRDLQMLVLGESGRQLVLGMVAGAGALWLCNRLIDRVLSGAFSWQPLVIVTAAALVALSCLLATWRPTTQAAHADPTRCLRAD